MVIVGPVVLHGVIGSTLITASRAGHFVGVGLITAGHGAGGTSLDWPSLAVSIVAAAIALFAVIYSAKSTHAAQDSAGSGKRSAAAAPSGRRLQPSSKRRFSCSCARALPSRMSGLMCGLMM